MTRCKPAPEAGGCPRDYVDSGPRHTGESAPCAYESGRCRAGMGRSYVSTTFQGVWPVTRYLGISAVAAPPFFAKPGAGSETQRERFRAL